MSIRTQFQSFTRFCAALTLLGAVVSAPAYAGGEVSITKDALKIGGVKYFSGKAENVRLGSYGEKKTPVGQVNYLAVEKNIKAEHLAEANVQTLSPVKINWSKVSKADLDGSVTFFKKGGGTGSATLDKAKSANLEMYKVFLNAGALKGLLNKKADGARAFLDKEGRDGRVVGEVWILISGELADEIRKSGGVEAFGKEKGIEIRVKGSKSSKETSTITLSENTTFAYMLYKAKIDRKSGKVEDLEDDQPGIH